MRNGRERDGLVEDPEQTEDPGQVEETGQGDETGYGGEPGHVEDPEQLGQGDKPGQVEEPELLERLLQVSDDDAPAHALVDSEIIRDRDQGPWEFLVEYVIFNGTIWTWEARMMLKKRPLSKLLLRTRRETMQQTTSP
ncbi:hypothetical protein F443_09841 [Phytophthora nicotianae P1569]|uniref:Chromo domain-containing protein n=1 Tax=Phytophthora nicotianae P1569 TaxID=1317065 RepID=V9F3I2_PHYNI|nr:hypothetical protein F443_09841 [Phytophthora nicotianae P1569]